jgi:hypothetical protein
MDTISSTEPVSFDRETREQRTKRRSVEKKNDLKSPGIKRSSAVYSTLTDAATAALRWHISNAVLVADTDEASKLPSPEASEIITEASSPEDVPTRDCETFALSEDKVVEIFGARSICDF